jgi:hypothetical protein
MGLKERQITGLPETPTCLGPALEGDPQNVVKKKIEINKTLIMLTNTGFTKQTIFTDHPYEKYLA